MPDILTGYALPTAMPPGADHTYVRSNKGHNWGCFGRDAGGEAICAGDGKADQAQCLSEPTSTAGIVYGVTGVCHQAANRIMLPANTVVARARGYRFSALLYGTYGRVRGTLQFSCPKSFRWPELDRCDAK